MNEFMGLGILLLALAGLKSVLFGSDFNFYYYFKYRKEYARWYSNRPPFEPEVLKAAPVKRDDLKEELLGLIMEDFEKKDIDFVEEYISKNVK